MSLIAYVDESEPDQRADPGVYLLAAAIVADDVAGHARTAMSRLLRPGQHKVHWNREQARHQELVKTITATDTAHLVVVRTGDTSSSERRRRLCLERLLYELEALEVARVVVEARQAKQNASDMKMMAALRARRVISGAMRMDHIPGPAEPLLWMSDVVAGAYGAYRQGNGAHLDVLDPMITVHVCE